MLESIEITSGPHPSATVIWMHGLGADGNDFVPIVRELDLQGCAPIRFVFPHAPMRAVTVNGGYMMRAWYDILGSEILQREDEKGLRASQAAVDALIDHEKTRGIPAERIVLAGFSQGCAIALQTGLRYGERLAGILGLSGYLPLSALISNERHTANANTPIFLAHGSFDPVVPYLAASASRDILQGLGHPVEWHDYPMAHTVCGEEIAHISDWLSRVLPD